MYEAKNHLSKLLGRAERGEAITITRRGKPIAKLVPAAAESTPASRLAAIEAMRQLAARNRMAGLHVKELIAEGRR